MEIDLTVDARKNVNVEVSAQIGGFHGEATGEIVGSPYYYDDLIGIPEFDEISAMDVENMFGKRR